MAEPVDFNAGQDISIKQYMDTPAKIQYPSAVLKRHATGTDASMRELIREPLYL